MAVCAWMCMAWSWTPHPHTKPCSGNLDIFPYIITSSDSCKQTSWDIGKIRDGKREIQLRGPRNCNWLHQSRSLMNKIHRKIWFHNSVFCTQSNLHTREQLIFGKIRQKVIITVSHRALNTSVTVWGKGLKTHSQNPLFRQTLCCLACEDPATPTIIRWQSMMIIHGWSVGTSGGLVTGPFRSLLDSVLVSRHLR